MTYYKAVKMDGHSFRGDVDYLAGDTISHPNPGTVSSDDPSGYLSISTHATDCTGFSWPARLLEVEPVGEVWTPHASDTPNKRAVHAVMVVREVDARLLLGPQSDQIVALVERCRSLSLDEARRLDAARAASRAASRSAARDAASRAASWAAARDALRDASRDASRDAAGAAAWAASWSAWSAWAAAWAARDAAVALCVRDLITPAQYATLTGPWAKVIGKVHPDDEVTS